MRGWVDIGADEECLGLKGSPTQVRSIFAPEVNADKMMIEGTPGEQVDNLIRELRKIKCL